MSAFSQLVQHCAYKLNPFKKTIQQLWEEQDKAKAHQHLNRLIKSYEAQSKSNPNKKSGFTYEKEVNEAFSVKMKNVYEYSSDSDLEKSLSLLKAGAVHPEGSFGASTESLKHLKLLMAYSIKTDLEIRAIPSDFSHTLALLEQLTQREPYLLKRTDAGESWCAFLASHIQKAYRGHARTCETSWDDMVKVDKECLVDLLKQGFEVLTSAGADLNQKDKSGLTVLSYAAGDCSETDAMPNGLGVRDSLLYEFSKEHDAVPALWVALKDNPLLNQKQSLNLNSSPIHVAAMSRSKYMMQELVKAGHDIQVTDQVGNNALHYLFAGAAVSKMSEHEKYSPQLIQEFLELMKILVKQGVSWHQKNKRGTTPLEVLTELDIWFSPDQYRSLKPPTDSLVRKVLEAFASAEADYLGASASNRSGSSSSSKPAHRL